MTTDFPLGINLGPEHFTSAYITATNEVVTVACVEASQAWKDFYLDTLKVNRDSEYKDTHSRSPEMNRLIHSTLSSIREASEEQLGRQVEISAIGYPEHFRMGAYLREIMDAALKTYPGIKNIKHAGSYLNNIRRAYGLNTPEGFRYAPGQDLDDYNSLLLFFDYQKRFLEISIMAVGEISNIRNQCYRFDNFGGDENIASPEELTDLKTRTQSLVNQELRSTTSPTHLYDFRFIIFSGEAPRSEFQKIRECIIEIFPAFSDRFLYSIDPFWTGAIAAAQRAKEFTIDPPKPFIFTDYQLIEEVLHFHNLQRKPTPQASNNAAKVNPSLPCPLAVAVTGVKVDNALLVPVPVPTIVVFGVEVEVGDVVLLLLAVDIDIDEDVNKVDDAEETETESTWLSDGEDVVSFTLKLVVVVSSTFVVTNTLTGITDDSTPVPVPIPTPKLSEIQRVD